VGFGLDLSEGKGDGGGVAVGCEGVDPGSSRIAEAEEFGHLVEGFAGGIVDGVADVAVGPAFAVLAGEVEVGVSAGNDEGEDWSSRDWPSRRWRFARVFFGDVLVGELGLFEQDGVDVAFEVVHGDERLVEGVGERFGVADADEQGSSEAGTGGDGDGVEVGEGGVSLTQGGADDRNDVAQVLAGGEFGDDSAIGGVDGDLRSDDARECFGSAAHDGGGGFVAGAFDAEDEAGGLSFGDHPSMVKRVMGDHR